MKRPWRCSFWPCAALPLAMLSQGALADGFRHALTELSAIPLAAGSNRIEHFAADGRPGIITLGWRDNGNAYGYCVFLVLMPTAADAADWNVVGIESGDASGLDDDIVKDDPHTGEDAVTAVRFAHGRVDGAPATLLLVASRMVGATGTPAPAVVRYQAFRLVRNYGTSKASARPTISS